MNPEFSEQIFDKRSNIKFHIILSSGNRVDDCGRTDRTKLIVACNYAKAPSETGGEGLNI